MDILFLGLIFAAIIVIIIIIPVMRQIKTAHLISENSIICITPVEAGKQSVSVNISCFGISIGHKYYKFNREGIRLTRVDINKTSITIYFGKAEKQYKIRVLHEISDLDEANRIAGKFTYETGVIPTINGW